MEGGRESGELRGMKEGVGIQKGEGGRGRG